MALSPTRHRSTADGGAARISVAQAGRLPTPLYHQIYLVLRDKIVSGAYVNGANLPGEQALTEQFGVSRITAKRALNELAAVGLVERARGRGTRVTYEAPQAPVQTSIEGLIENLLAMGLNTEVRLIAFDYVSAADDVARALGREPGDRVQHAVRVRVLEGEPFSYLTTYVPEDLGRSYSRRDLASVPLLQLLERAGVIVSAARQTLTATLADPTVAHHLRVEVGAPLLKIVRVVSDQSGRPVEFITGLYRPDKYQYRMNLTRVGVEARRQWTPAVER